MIQLHEISINASLFPWCFNLMTRYFACMIAKRLLLAYYILLAWRLMIKTHFNPGALLPSHMETNRSASEGCFFIHFPFKAAPDVKRNKETNVAHNTNYLHLNGKYARGKCNNWHLQTQWYLCHITPISNLFLARPVTAVHELYLWFYSEVTIRWQSKSLYEIELI